MGTTPSTSEKLAQAAQNQNCQHSPGEDASYGLCQSEESGNPEMLFKVRAHEIGVQKKSHFSSVKGSPKGPRLIAAYSGSVGGEALC